jgi:predicted transcriptional regulator
MTATLVKDKAHSLVDQMPENSTWDDLIHEIYVREAIEQGLADSKAGRTMEVREVRAQYGLPK